MTAALYEHTTTNAVEFVGVDLSENMVAEYNAKFSTRSSEVKKEAPKAHAYVGDLVTPADLPRILPDVDVEGEAEIPISGSFDLVIVGYAFHHFASPPRAAKRLAGCLKPGGVLMIVELAVHDPEPEAEAEKAGRKQGVKTAYGFEEEEVKDFFEGVGLVDFDALRMEGGVVIRSSHGGDSQGKGQEMGAFMARARKPA